MPIQFISGSGLQLQRRASDADCFLSFTCCVNGVHHIVEVNATSAGNTELQAFMDQCGALAKTSEEKSLRNEL